MALSLGIVGLPNVGKSTLFNALLKRQIAFAANYPFATIEPNIGIVEVPDDRLNKLAEVVKHEYGNKKGDREVPEKIISAAVKFYDIAGLVKGASQGEGLGNKFLAHIREVDAIVHVVRGFDDEDVVRAGSVSPKEDIETINVELILSDLQVLDRRLDNLRTETKRSKSLDDERKLALFENIKAALDFGKPANTLSLTPEEVETAKELNLLTLKPMIYVINVNEADLISPQIRSRGRSDPARDQSLEIKICAKIESELSSLDEADQKLYMEELGITESGLDKVIKKGYDILGLQTFLTAGPKEVRAWTIKKGTKAPQAAGVIHTDFERGFIAAEIISFDAYIQHNGVKGAKEKGLLRIEGKNYVMRDGDVVEFRFSA